MYRECSRCHHPFSVRDFARGDSKKMEVDRKAAGLEGVRFFLYTCQACGRGDIFVELHHLPGESEQDFQARRQAFQDLVQKRRGCDIDAVLSERSVARPLCGASTPF
jgi:hypothetical protein